MGQCVLSASQDCCHVRCKEDLEALYGVCAEEPSVWAEYGDKEGLPLVRKWTELYSLRRTGPQRGGGNSSFIKKQDFSQIVVDGHESGQLLETPSMSLPCVRPVMYFPLCQLPVIGSSCCFFCPVFFTVHHNIYFFLVSYFVLDISSIKLV